MTPDEFRALLFAPEIIVVDLLDASLLALDRALRVEHPLVDLPPDDQPLIGRRARVVLRRAQRLRAALRDYQGAVRDILREADEGDSPF